jgi:hypothetical protein
LEIGAVIGGRSPIPMLSGVKQQNTETGECRLDGAKTHQTSALFSPPFASTCFQLLRLQVKFQMGLNLGDNIEFLNLIEMIFVSCFLANDNFFLWGTKMFSTQNFFGGVRFFV